MIPIEMDIRIPKSPVFTGKAARLAGEEVVREMHRSVAKLKTPVVQMTPVNTGMTAKAVQSSVSVLGASLEVQGRVFNPLSHAPAIEDGAKPHFPPIGPIRLWVIRKLGVTSEKDIGSVAFLVARKISRDGTKAHHMFSLGYLKAKQALDSGWERCLRRINGLISGGS